MKTTALNGKKPKKLDPRNLQFKDYLLRKPRPKKLFLKWANELLWVARNVPQSKRKAVNNPKTKLGELGVMLNTMYFDCGCAGAGHCIQAWTAIAHGKMITIPDLHILLLYQATAPFNPMDMSTNTGCYMLDILKYWHQYGIFDGIQSHTIAAYVDLNPSHTVAKSKKIVGNIDQDHVKLSIEFFGPLYCGIRVPDFMNEQILAGEVLNPNTINNPPTINQCQEGHTIVLIGYDEIGLIYISLGTYYKMSWDFFARYADEAYCIITTDWIKKFKPTESNFQIQKLFDDVKGILAP